ncbi:MAG TPA: hypothetical protein VD947_01740 [Patescibacteria group bacterium]|nr:hypothetical protein [Patescibacteria group bacterium]
MTAGSAAALATREDSPESMAGPSPIEFSPQPSGGFLLQREDDSVVNVQVKTLEEDAFLGGKTRLTAYSITTETPEGETTNASYNSRLNLPGHLIADTLIEGTTAWGTRGGKRGREQRGGGFNDDLMFLFNELHHGSLFIEPQGKTIGASLADSARDISYIGNIERNHRMGRIDIRPDKVIYASPSRGAAIGLGVEDVVYAELLAPCFLRPGTIQELPRDAKQLGREGWELGKHIASLGLRGALANQQTFSKNPLDFLYTVMAIPHLRNGDAGRLLLSNSADFTHVTLFDQDGWSQPDETTRTMTGLHNNMHLTLLPGRHITLAHPLVLQALIERVDTIAEMRGFDGDFKEVDFEKITQIQPELPQTAGLLGSFSVGNTLKTAYNLVSFS